MILVKAKPSDETVTIELTFDELMIVTDMLTGSYDNHEDDDLYDTLLVDFKKLSTDVIILENAMRQVGLK